MEGNLHLKIDWASLIHHVVGSKFMFLLCFIFGGAI